LRRDLRRDSLGIKLEIRQWLRHAPAESQIDKDGSDGQSFAIGGKMAARWPAAMSKDMTQTLFPLAREVLEKRWRFYPILSRAK
jgi:hypothetical protein